MVGIASAMDVSGDVAIAAAALAGLALVFLGATSTSYEAYPQVSRDYRVRARDLRRGWSAFIGFALSLLAAFSALIGKWLHEECCALAALALFCVGLLAVLVAGALSVRDIR